MGIETWHEQTAHNPTWLTAEKLKNHWLEELNLPKNTIKKGQLTDIFELTALFRFNSHVKPNFSSLTPWEKANAIGQSEEILSSPIITLIDIDEVLTRNWATLADLGRQLKAGGKISQESFRQTVRDHIPWRNLMALERLNRIENNHLVITTRRFSKESFWGKTFNLFSPKVEGFLPCFPILDNKRITKIKNRYQKSHVSILGESRLPYSSNEGLIKLIESKNNPYVVVVESSLYPGLCHYYNLLKRLQQDEYPFDRTVCIYGGHLVL